MYLSVFYTFFKFFVRTLETNFPYRAIKCYCIVLYVECYKIIIRKKLSSLQEKTNIDWSVIDEYRPISNLSFISEVTGRIPTIHGTNKPFIKSSLTLSKPTFSLKDQCCIPQRISLRLHSIGIDDMALAESYGVCTENWHTTAGDTFAIELLRFFPHGSLLGYLCSHTQAKSVHIR